MFIPIWLLVIVIIVVLDALDRGNGKDPNCRSRAERQRDAREGARLVADLGEWPFASAAERRAERRVDRFKRFGLYEATCMALRDWREERAERKTAKLTGRLERDRQRILGQA